MYITENYYFKDRKIDFIKILRVTAQAVGQWCDWFEAHLLMPIKNVNETERTGMLPENSAEKQKFIDELILWLTNNSESQETFRLFLDSNPISQDHKFQHHDDTCCWYLNLSKKEFVKLQAIWKENGLPEDLFYPADEALRLLKPLGFWGKIFTTMGFTWQSFELFSPKEWQEELKKNPDSINKLSRHIPG